MPQAPLKLLAASLGAALLAGMPASASSPADTRRVAALLTNGRLVVASAASGEVVLSRTLVEDARIGSVGSYLAMDKSGSTLYALVRGEGQGKIGSLFKIDARTGAVVRQLRLVDRAIYRGLALGPRTGAPYLFGNRVTGDKEVVALRIDRELRAVRARWTVRRRGSGWVVFEGAISPDEGRLFVSYHGSSTQGVDWIGLGAGAGRCRGQQSNRACIRSHGGIEPLGSRVLAATGSPVILDVHLQGRVRRRLDTRLTGNHLIELALDRATAKAFAVGSCGYAGGLSVIDLQTQRARTLGHPAPKQTSEAALRAGICGERLAIGSALVAIAKTHRPVPQPGAEGALLLVDSERGEIVHSIKTASEPVDVAWLD